jgi:hypothetical protein
MQGKHDILSKAAGKEDFKQINYKAFMHALMEFRATPRTDSYSPSQVFYGRRMKTGAPLTASIL